MVDIVSKCSGMSTGEESIHVINDKGELLYNKQIQEKINENTRKINQLNSEFWDGIRTEHSKEENKKFDDYQKTEFRQFWDEINSSDMSIEEKNKEVEFFNKQQQEEYNKFWGIETAKKTKDSVYRHEHAIKEIKRELSDFMTNLKTRQKHYFLIIKEIAQIYWDRLSAMLSVLIQNLPNASTGSNIRDILIKVEQLNSNPSKCTRIIQNEENNCIVSAILNLLTGIILFKEEFPGDTELDTDDVKLAGSIIINTKYQPEYIPEEEVLEEDNEQTIFDVGEEGLFPIDEIDEDDEDKEDDYGDNEDDENLEENPYFGFKWGAVTKTVRKKKTGGKQINNEKDLKAIEMKLIQISKNTRDYRPIAKEIMNIVNIIKNHNNMSQKVKQNRINFFATIR